MQCTHKNTCTHTDKHVYTMTHVKTHMHGHSCTLKHVWAHTHMHSHTHSGLMKLNGFKQTGNWDLTDSSVSVHSSGIKLRMRGFGELTNGKLHPSKQLAKAVCDVSVDCWAGAECKTSSHRNHLPTAAAPSQPLQESVTWYKRAAKLRTSSFISVI